MPTGARSRHSFAHWAASVTLLSLASGCGFGSATVAASVGGGGGSTNAPSTPAGLLVLDAKVSPARLRIVLTDAEDDAATVEFFYALPGSPDVVRPMQKLASNPVTLAASRAGVTHDLPWDFAAEDGLPDDASFTGDVRILARVRGGTDQSNVVGLGNDAPVVDQIGVPTTEASGIVAVAFRVADSSSDVVDVEAEFFDESDPAAGWRPARAAGTAASTPGPAFRGIVAPAAGTTLTFFWDTDLRGANGQPLGDLVDLERDVRLRFVARDSVVAQAPVESPTFRVDNNDAPQVQIDEGLVLSRVDRVGSILIPYRVFDEESDPVAAVFQWRRADQVDFPPLGTTDFAELAELLRDPRFVREKQVCRPGRSIERGRLTGVQPDRVRLPALLSGSMASTLARGLVGRELELLRPAVGTTSLAAQWNDDPLQAPVAVLARQQLDRALVLDDVGGSSRLLELALSTGAVVRTVATLPGVPSAMAYSYGRGSVLVATDAGAGWQVFEVALDDGATALVLEQGSTGIAGPLRGIAARGSTRALATAGSTLVDLSWSTTPTVRVVVGNLAEPRGVAVDPRGGPICYVAERAAAGPNGPGRVTVVDLDHLTLEPLAGLAPAMPQPSALALTQDGTLLQVLCEPVGQLPRLVAVPLATAAPAQQTMLVAQANAIATGPDDLVLVSVRATPDLLVQGGVEQRRAIVAFEGRTATATVDAPFAPPARNGQAWRLAGEDPFFASTAAAPGGAPARFVWDSSDAPVGHDVFLRVTPVDSEAGLPDSTSGALVLGTRLSTPPRALPVSVGRDGVVSADLDGDGDLDLVTAQAAGPTILTQVNPGEFVAGAVLATAGQGGAVAIDVADMNGDGRLDVIAGLTSGAVSIHLQNPGGTFPGTPQLIGAGLGLPSAAKLVVADCDADGRPDLLFRGGFTVFVFFQTGPMVFDATPQVLSGPFQTEMTDFCVADFDGDGRLEIAATETDVTPGGGSHDVVVFRQSTPRDFGPVAFDVRDFSRRVSCLSPADYDADGDVDLAVAVDDPEGGLFVLGQSGNGRFSQATIALFSNVQEITDGIADLAWTDLDGDGDLDLVGANPSSSRVVVLTQLETGLLSSVPLLLGGPGSTPSASAVFAGELDGDGKIDLLVSTGSGTRLLSQDGADSLAAAANQIGGPSSTSSSEVLVTGRFDAADRLGLMTSNLTGPIVSLNRFPQEANGTFGPAQPTQFLPAALGVRNLVAHDFDGDGDTDVVYTTLQGSTTLGMLTTTGPGTFAVSSLGNGSTLLPGEVHAGDLDGDGDLDLLAGAVVLLQGPTGAFTALAQPLALTGKALADCDHDGDLDVVGVSGGGSVAILFQTAPGVFAATPITVPVTGTVQAIAAGDLDGDGDTDLAVGTSGNLTLLLQGPPGTLTALPAPFAGARTAVVVADVDGDAKDDVVTCGAGGLQVLRQTAPGRFATLPTVLGPSTLDDIVVADLDGDGTPDLAVTDAVQTRIRIFYGGR